MTISVSMRGHFLQGRPTIYSSDFESIQNVFCLFLKCVICVIYYSLFSALNDFILKEIISLMMNLSSDEEYKNIEQNLYHVFNPHQVRHKVCWFVLS